MIVTFPAAAKLAAALLALALSPSAFAGKKSCIAALGSQNSAPVFASSAGKVFDAFHERSGQTIYRHSPRIETASGKIVDIGEIPDAKNLESNGLQDFKVIGSKGAVLAVYSGRAPYSSLPGFASPDSHFIIAYDIATGSSKTLESGYNQRGAQRRLTVASSGAPYFVVHAEKHMSSNPWSARDEASEQNISNTIYLNRGADAQVVGATTNPSAAKDVLVTEKGGFIGIVFEDGGLEIYAVGGADGSRLTLSGVFGKDEIAAIKGSKTLVGFFGTPETKAMRDLVNQIK